MTLVRSTPSRKPLITVYLTRKASPYALRSHTIRWVHLLKEARRQLEADHSGKEIDSLMDPLWKLKIEDILGNGSASLAVFHGAEGTHLLRIPFDIEDRCVVARSFHIKPILHWLQSDPHFWLLTLGSKRVRLHRGSLAGLECVREFDAPETETETRRQHSRSPESNKDRRKSGVLRFFKQVEQEVGPIIGKDRHPVIIAGVKSLIPVYRQVNRDPDLVTEFIPGSPETWSASELREKSGEILMRLFERAKQEAIREYESAEPTGGATTLLPAIIDAADRGKIRKLLVAHDLNLWGSFSPHPARIRLHPEKISAEEDDILDDLAELVLARGGKVLTLPLAQMPHLEPAAAIFR